DKIASLIESTSEVQEAVQRLGFQGCDAPPITITWPVGVLMAELKLGNWMDVTTNKYRESSYGASPANVLGMWEYGDEGIGIGPQLAGGVGFGGHPPSNAVNSDDDRVLSGSVILVI